MKSPVTPSVEQRLAAESGASTIHDDSVDPLARVDGRRAASKRNGDPVLATVNGRNIARREFDDLLMQSRGLAILEPLIVLEAAEAEAAKLGISITQAMIDQEYDESLRQLLNPQLQSDDSATLTPSERSQGERVLTAHLSERNLSRGEFQLAVRRNVLLRALASRQVRVTPETVNREAQTLIGPRIQVRHIQLASLRDVQLISEKVRGGESFENLARQFSANVATADEGGLMAPFTAEDSRVPAAIRQAAFALSGDQVSDPIRVDPWYHFLKLESQNTMTPLTPEQARIEAESRLRGRLLPDTMQTLYRSLLESADIRIRDPLLADLWRDRNSSSEGR